MILRNNNMHVKHYAIGAYVIIALLVSFYFKGCTHTSNESYAFNLGRAILWPITLINGH
jgi:hypothetical protein